MPWNDKRKEKEKEVEERRGIIRIRRGRRGGEGGRQCV